MTTRNTTKLILVRHGHNDPQGRFRQHSCTGLTDLGRNQAHALAAQLARQEDPVDVIMTSRAARAAETAAIVADALGHEVAEPTCDLCEMHPGQAEGITVAEMREQYGPTYAAVPGGEYWPDWLPGATTRLQELADRHRGQTVMAFTHVGIIKASFHAYGGMPASTAEPIPADNTARTVWTQPADAADPRGGVWSLERHNDTAHLHG